MANKTQNNKSYVFQVILLSLLVGAALLVCGYFSHPEPRASFVMYLVSTALKSFFKACLHPAVNPKKNFAICRNIMSMPSRTSIPNLQLEMYSVAAIPTSETLPGNFTMKIYSSQVPKTDEELKRERLVYYVHGGAFILGQAETYEDFFTHLVLGRNMRVVAINYRLAPEYVFPTAVEDVVQGYQWILEHYPNHKRIIVMGDSAGGNLAAALTHIARDRNISPEKLVFQALIYPTTSCNEHLATYESWQKYGAIAYIIDEEIGRRVKPLYMPHESNDTRYCVLHHPDFTGLPPAAVVTAELDVLRTEGELYAKKLEENGVSVAYYMGKSQVHGFVAFPTYEKKVAWQFILENLNKHVPA